MTELTHIGPDGRAHMVDIGAKPVSQRSATATGLVLMQAATFDLARRRNTKKGDPLAMAELAGIMAAKRTADLIPLCHPLALTSVKVKITPVSQSDAFRVEAVVKTTGRTGVEMEALTAVSAACLTLYDMLKAVDKTMRIDQIELVEKTGGRSGLYRKTET